VFLCYTVNDQTLPLRHGYPLRIVADDEYGDRWVKYVYRLEALIGGEETMQEDFTPGL
jgi:sulfoxide reductase catalytic subunit YedY